MGLRPDRQKQSCRTVYFLTAVGCIALMLLFVGSVTWVNAATTIANYGDITVMEYDGVYDADIDTTTTETPRREIANEFFSTGLDAYDFLIVFTNYDFNMPSEEVLAFYQPIKNDVQGIGITAFDNSALYGSSGRLQGYIDMGNLANIESDPMDADFTTTMTILSHELLHRWAAHVQFMDGGSPSSALLGKDNSHWSYLLDTGASVLYGNAWQDNGDGTFTSGAGMKYFSPLDLYLMGLNDAPEVPPMLLIDNGSVDATQLPEENATISGTATYVTIDDIIAAEGARIPSAADAPKQFKIGCILLTRQGTFTGEELYPIRKIITNWETWFLSQTDGKGSVSFNSNPLDNIPTNPGISPPTFEPRTTPFQVADGVTWLTANQAADGSWSDNPRTTERDTAAAILALNHITGVDQNLTDGVNWFLSLDDTQTDYLARKIEALLAHGNNVSGLIATLKGLQNSDGGWGSAAGYISNSDDSALALKALALSGDVDNAVLDPAVNFLLSHQNADGGWGYGSGQSHLRPTVNTLDAFYVYRASYSLETAIQNGLAWVQARQNPDGGFGPGASTVIDTANVLPMVYVFAVESEVTNPALDFLFSQQQLDGSWNHRSSDTALALNAIINILQDPELAISADDIVFTPDIISAVPTTLTVDATIVNNGFTDVAAVTVGIYDGPVAPVNLIDSQTISVAGQASTAISFSITLNDGRSRRLYIAVDADDTISEPNESNNIAYKEALPQITYPAAIPDLGTFDTVGEGTASDDLFNGTSGSDLLQGHEGDDDLNGGDGDDWLVGGADNDYLAGGAGDDIYYYEPGFGQDQIDNSGGGFDGIVFGGAITVDDLQIRRDGDDLVIRVICTTDQITILGWYVDADYQVDYVQPMGGYGITALEIEQMAAAEIAAENPVAPDESTFDAVFDRNLSLTQLNGTTGNDLLRGADQGDEVYVNGYEGDDWLVGGADFELMWSGPGDDVLIGGDGEDQLNGEEGNDTLYGGAGYDRYIYDADGGRDEIHNQGGGNDRLFFLDSVTAARLFFYRYCDDLVIRVDDDSQRQVTVVNWFMGEDYEIAYIQTDDDVLNVSEVNALVVPGDVADAWSIPDEATFDNVSHGTGSPDTLAGTNGTDLLRGYEGDDQLQGLADDDWLVGDGGNDTLDGGDGNDTQMGGDGNDQLGGDAGNDRLRGGDGDDTYYYGPGSGADEIYNLDAGTDELVFTGGITTDRLTFLQDGDNLIIRVDNDPLTQVTVVDWFAGSQYELSQVSPDGGPVLTAAEINQMFEDPPPGDEDFTIPDTSTFDSVVTGTAAGEQLVGTNGNDLIQGLEGDDQLHAFDGADWVVGGDGNDYIDGYEGDDTQIGGPGNDQLEGSAGNDRLKGGTGDDVYVFRPGFGADRIYNSDGGTDWIIFTDDLTEARLSFYRLGLDLIIRVDEREDLQVTVRRWFEGGEYEVDYIQPSDSSFGIPASEINNRVVVIGTPGDYDFDDDVDGADLATLADDINSGQADATDLAAFAVNFGQQN